jgi:hypothetical protein
MRWGRRCNKHEKIHSDFCSKYLEESDHLADLGRRSLEKVWTGYIWLKITCGDGLF